MLHVQNFWLPSIQIDNAIFTQTHCSWAAECNQSARARPDYGKHLGWDGNSPFSSHSLDYFSTASPYNGRTIFSRAPAVHWEMFHPTRMEQNVFLLGSNHPNEKKNLCLSKPDIGFYNIHEKSYADFNRRNEPVNCMCLVVEILTKIKPCTQMVSFAPGKGPDCVQDKKREWVCWHLGWWFITAFGVVLLFVAGGSCPSVQY